MRPLLTVLDTRFTAIGFPAVRQLVFDVSHLTSTLRTEGQLHGQHLPVHGHDMILEPGTVKDTSLMPFPERVQRQLYPQLQPRDALLPVCFSCSAIAFLQ